LLLGGCASVLKRYPDAASTSLWKAGAVRIEKYEASGVGYLVGEVEYMAIENEPINHRLPKKPSASTTTSSRWSTRTRSRRWRRDKRLSVVVLSHRRPGWISPASAALETSSENQRLKLLRNYLAEVVPKLTRASEIERVIRSDGYLPRNTTPEVNEQEDTVARKKHKKALNA